MLILKRTMPEKYKHMSHNSFDEELKMSVETHFPFSKQAVAVIFFNHVPKSGHSLLSVFGISSF